MDFRGTNGQDTVKSHAVLLIRDTNVATYAVTGDGAHKGTKLLNKNVEKLQFGDQTAYQVQILVHGLHAFKITVS